MIPAERVIVIGTSTGGIDALRVLVAGLPPQLPAAVLVVVHTGPSGPNLVDRILERAGALPAHNATAGELIEPGHIYVARADHHLVIGALRRVVLTKRPRENRFRPAIDPLFRSAAAVYGPAAIGVVLTGLLDDGTAGLWAIKERAGVAVVQNPEEAVAPSMPLNALKHVEVNHCVKLEQMAGVLTQLVNTPIASGGGKPMNPELEAEVKVAQEDHALASRFDIWGDPSLFACPECHGVLLERKVGSNVRYRCHTGHAYSLEALMSELEDKTEQALWNVLRSLEETTMLLEQTATKLEAQGQSRPAETMRRRVLDVRQRANRVRAVLYEDEPLSEKRTA